MRLSSSAPRFPAGLLLVILGLLFGIGLVGFLALPRVEAFSPANNARELASYTPLHITFNRSMDHTSVELALHLTPDPGGEFTWDDNRLTFTPLHPWPANSLVAVWLAGGQSERGLPLLGETRWVFYVSGKRLAYLLGEPANVWVSSLDTDAAPRQITHEPLGVEDFDLMPDGLQLIYAAHRADGGALLKLAAVDGSAVTDLLPCPDETCFGPVIAPDGRRLAYERGALVSGRSTIHIYTFATGNDLPLSDTSDSDVTARLPRWGSDGRLSYYDTQRQAIVIQNLDTQQVTYIPATSGEMGSWSPDGQYLVYPEIFFPVEPVTDTISETEHIDKFFSHLLRVTIATNDMTNLSGEGFVEDASPVYAHSGAWLAFGRRGLAADQWTPGRQLWLMRPDGSEAHALTAEPFFNHSGFQWSPDSAWIAYMRFNAADPISPAEIWVIKTDGTDARQISVGGFLPQWLP